MISPVVRVVRIVQVFFKAPIKGKVKTRLIPSVGEDGSVIVHQRLCEQVIQCVTGYAAQQTESDVRVQFWVDMGIDHPFITEKSEQYGVDVFQQVGDDLGQRMANALAVGLDSAEQVIVVGGDCYSICSLYLMQAFEMLESHDLVLGPADDGGYILLGATSIEPSMLQNIEWGVSTVLQATVDRAEQSGKRVGLLDERWDIDTLEDIQRHAPELLLGLPV